MSLHLGWVYTELWILAPVAELAMWIVALAVYSVALISLARGRRWKILLLALILVIAGPAVRLSPDLRIWARFHLERPAFDAVVTLVEQGRFAQSERDGYYGPKLPQHLCFVSANCRVKIWDSVGDRPVLFLPDRIGIPDDAVGYAHFPGDPPPGPYDGFGMAIYPVTHLGDGWWWLEHR
ncbi:hypothetical protein [Nonomuraea sp. NPDC046570]|uniref:hypothetical protein n=1 Tax=Nonomuraea sp. NPDC046570 TaxID=3155255 RepID=UPI0033D6D224